MTCSMNFFSPCLVQADYTTDESHQWSEPEQATFEVIAGVAYPSVARQREEYEAAKQGQPESKEDGCGLQFVSWGDSRTYRYEECAKEERSQQALWERWIWLYETT